VLNIQPVIPIHLTSDWNIITRTILPIISLPAFAPGQNRTNGTGDVQISAFLSPANPGAWIWGVGAVTQLPTHSNDLLGNNNAGLGPSFVILHLEHGSPWVYGVLVNNVWSVGNSAGKHSSLGVLLRGPARLCAELASTRSASVPVPEVVVYARWMRNQ
jgi:hypothetical protein